MATHNLHGATASITGTTYMVGGVLAPYPLDISSGTITLDNTWSPYCQVELVCVAPADSIIELIDPTLTQRVSITVTESFGTVGQWSSSPLASTSRTFNLALRSRIVDAVAQTLTITAVSDEALLQDLTKLTTTLDRTYGLSVQNAVSHALSKIGATLSGTPADFTLTPSLPALTSTPNLFQNPSAATDVATFLASTQSGYVTLTRNSGVGHDATAGFARYTVPSAIAANSSASFNIANTYTGPTSGGTYQIGGWFRTSSAITCYPRVLCTGFDTAQTLTAIAVPANVWTYFGTTVTLDEAPGSTLTFYIQTNAAIPSGTTLDLDDTSLYNADEYSVVNQLPNPSVTTSVGTWGAGGSNGTLTRQTGLTGSPVSGVTTFTHTTWTGASGAGSGGASAGASITSQAGQTWSVGAWVRANVAQPVALSLAITGGTYQLGASVTLTPNTWTWITQTFTTPTSTTAISPYCYTATGTQWASGNTFDTLGWVVVCGSTVPASFDGNTTSGLYSYAWAGSTNNSSSIQTYIPNSDSCVWLPGVTAWDWLQPMIQAGNLYLFCDEQRNWNLVSAGAYTVSGLVSLSSDVGLLSATDSIDLDNNSDFFASVCITYQAPADPVTGLVPAPEYDIATLTGVAGPCLQITYDYAYPGPGGAAAVLAARGGFKRSFAITAESQYLATPGQQLAITIPGGASEAGAVSSVTWSIPDGTMTVGSTGLVTIPAEAWSLASATKTWATATGTWTSYTNP